MTWGYPSHYCDLSRIQFIVPGNTEGLEISLWWDNPRTVDGDVQIEPISTESHPLKDKVQAMAMRVSRKAFLQRSLFSFNFILDVSNQSPIYIV